MLTETDFQRIFKNFGKIIYINKLVNGRVGNDGEDLDPPQPGALHEYKTAAMGAVDQAVSGDAQDWIAYLKMAKPLADSINTTVTNLTSLASQADGFVDAYLKSAVALELGLGTNANAQAVATELADKMDGTATVAPSGTAVGEPYTNVDGIWAYFFERFGVSLPVSNTPSIPDEYITSEVQA